MAGDDAPELLLERFDALMNDKMPLPWGKDDGCGVAECGVEEPEPGDEKEKDDDDDDVRL